MKVRVTMKDPDGVSEAIEDAIAEEVAKLSLPTDEAVELAAIKREKLNARLRPWLAYLEYVTVEIDLDANTATVIKDGPQ